MEGRLWSEVLIVIVFRHGILQLGLLNIIPLLRSKDGSTKSVPISETHFKIHKKKDEMDSPYSKMLMVEREYGFSL